MTTDLLLETLRRWPAEGYAAAIAAETLFIAAWVTQRSLRACDVRPGWSAWGWGLLAALLAGGLTWAALVLKCQETPEVRPSEFWWRLKPAYHALLIALLLASTATDFKTYYILDAVTLGGVMLAVLFAGLSGDLQLCHVWVDWNAEVPQLQGPYIPAWLGAHPHLHGMAWSLAGAAAGGGIAWGARWISSHLLGQEALGLGDVTLMGMIGAFMGWQPAVVVFLVAPMCAIAVGLAIRAVSSRTYLPYGPFLGLAAVLVLFNWRAIWMFELDLSAGGRAPDAPSVFALRRLFGDAPGLLILAAMMVGGVVLLLGAWRLYREIPVQARRTPEHSARPPKV